MKKLILTALLFASGLFAATSVNAQDRDYRDDRRQDKYNRQGNCDCDCNEEYNHLTVRNEYRYIQIGRKVYKEIYRSAYNRNGILVERVLISRKRASQYDNYNQNDRYDKYGRNRNSGIKFNIYVPF